MRLHHVSNRCGGTVVFINLMWHSEADSVQDRPPLGRTLSTSPPHLCVSRLDILAPKMYPRPLCWGWSATPS